MSIAILVAITAHGIWRTAPIAQKSRIESRLAAGKLSWNSCYAAVGSRFAPRRDGFVAKFWRLVSKAGLC